MRKAITFSIIHLLTKLFCPMQRFASFALHRAKIACFSRFGDMTGNSGVKTLPMMTKHIILSVHTLNQEKNRLEYLISRRNPYRYYFCFQCGWAQYHFLNFIFQFFFLLNQLKAQLLDIIKNILFFSFLFLFFSFFLHIAVTLCGMTHQDSHLCLKNL